MKLDLIIWIVLLVLRVTDVKKKGETNFIVIHVWTIRSDFDLF